MAAAASPGTAREACSCTEAGFADPAAAVLVPTPLIGISPLIGTYALSGLVVLLGGAVPFVFGQRRRRLPEDMQVADRRRLVADAHADARQRDAQRRVGFIEAHAVHARAALGEDALVLAAKFGIDLVDRIALLLVGGAADQQRRRAQAQCAPHSLVGRATRSASFAACWISIACSVAATRSCSTLAAALPERAAALYQT